MILLANSHLALLLLQLLNPGVASDSDSKLILMARRKTRLAQKILTKNLPGVQSSAASTNHPAAAATVVNPTPTPPPPHLATISIDDGLDVLNNRDHKGDNKSTSIARHLNYVEVNQIGSTIRSGNYDNNLGSEDYFGIAGNYSDYASIAFSSDGSIMAVGAKLGKNSSGVLTGYVKIYDKDNGEWVLRDTIYGPSVYSNFGYSVDLSSSGLTLAVGAPFHESNGYNFNGVVQVFDYNNGSWHKRLADIFGTSTNEFSGYSLSLSDAGNVVAVGSYWYSNGIGRVRVFTYQSGSWGQLGADLSSSIYASFGYAVSLSGDATTLVVGAPYMHDYVGSIRMFKYSNNMWTMDQEIIGSQANGFFGRSVSLSGDGRVVAAAGNGSFSPRVFVYGGTSTWNEIGGGISSAYNGISVSLDKSGSRLLVSDGTKASVYTIDSNSSEKLGGDITSNTSNDTLRGVVISSDGSVFALGFSQGVRAFKLVIEVPSTIPSVVPSSKPSSIPSKIPSAVPSSKPSSAPSKSPSTLPSASPSTKPSMTPSVKPSMLPSSVPTVTVSLKPSLKPSRKPTRKPTRNPSIKPTQRPSSNPIAKPSPIPSKTPTSQPSTKPSSTSIQEGQTLRPTIPTNRPPPSDNPSRRPSTQPSLRPTSAPSVKPSLKPQKLNIINDVIPTRTPSDFPSNVPSVGLNLFQPVINSLRPTKKPITFTSTKRPTKSPNKKPSSHPTFQPTHSPSAIPSFKPSFIPTDQPSISPTAFPSATPTKIDFVTIAQEFTGMIEGCKFPDEFHYDFESAIRSQISEISGEVGNNINVNVVWSDTVGTNCDPSVAPSGYPSLSPSAESFQFPSVVPSVVSTKGIRGASAYRLRRTQEAPLSSMFIVYKVSMRTKRNDIKLDNITATMLENEKIYLDEIIKGVPFFQELNDRYELKVETLPAVPSSVPSFLPTEEGRSQNPSVSQKPTETGEVKVLAAVSAAGAGASAAASSSAASSASSSSVSASSASSAAGGAAGGTGGPAVGANGAGGGGGGTAATPGADQTSNSSRCGATNSGPSTTDDASSGGKTNPKIQDVAPDAPEVEEDDRNTKQKRTNPNDTNKEKVFESTIEKVFESTTAHAELDQINEIRQMGKKKNAVTTSIEDQDEVNENGEDEA